MPRLSVTERACPRGVTPPQDSSMVADRDQRARQTALCYAAADDDIPEVVKLLNEGVEVNMRDYDSRTPLHIAASHGSTGAVRTLLERRADPNALDYLGLTPLDNARSRGRQDIMDALKGGGAVPSQLGLKQFARRENWDVSRDEVKLGDCLGETLKSKVYKADWMGTMVVAKFAKIEQQELLHEIELLAKLRHPDLVQFLGANLQETQVMFITEYMEGGDLQRYYDHRSRDSGRPFVPSWRQVLQWASAVARALSFLHGNQHKIIHRDLKPLNLLMSKDHRDVKVTDFGISKMTGRVRRTTGESGVNGSWGSEASRPGESFKPTMTGGVGSWRYMAPEVVRYQNYDEKVDIFSFGLILFFMCSGLPPFHERPQEDWMLQEYLHGREPRPRPSECRRGLGDIMTAAWHVEASKRPSAFQLVAALTTLATERNCMSSCALA